MVSIPSISDRMYRFCDDCVWYDLGNEECLANKIGYINNYDECNRKPDLPLPCRFHLTKDELCQILDPYFMG